MEQRIVKNHRELNILISALILNKKEAFTLPEIVEEVIKNPVFNHFCSTIELSEKVSEAIDVLIELGAVKGEKEFQTSSEDKFIVSNIT